MSTVFVALVIWYAVFLTDGPLSTWIAMPATVVGLVWFQHAKDVSYRFKLPMLLPVFVVPVVWSIIGIAHGNRLHLVADQAAHFLLFGLYFPMRWALTQIRLDSTRVWLLPTLVLACFTILIWLGHEVFHLNYGVRSPIMETALAYNPTSSFRVFVKGDLFFIPGAALMWVRVAHAKRPQLVDVIGLLAILAALVITGTRGLWIAAAVAIVWAVFARQPSEIWIRSFLIGAVAIALALISPAAAYVQHRIAGLAGSSLDVSTQIHSAEASQLLAAFSTNPIFGSGLGATLASGYVRAVDKPYLFELTYHQMLFQLGTLGTIAFLLPFASALILAFLAGVRWPKKIADDNLTMITVASGSLAGLLVASATNPYLFSAPGVIVVVITLAMVDSALDRRHGPIAIEQ